MSMLGWHVHCLKILIKPYYPLGKIIVRLEMPRLELGIFHKKSEL